jgi:diguanylate cyclase (GGDEF)-like protein
VLIADPEPRRAAMLRDIVEVGGYEVIVTRNGDEAKAMLRRRQLPVLVIANLSLPRLDGFALLAELRRVAGSAGPPVVVISSSRELSGAAWNLKERLGVTELLPADATEAQAQETLLRILPALGQGAEGDDRTISTVAYERWVSQTVDRYLGDVARRFPVALVVVSVVIDEHEWFRVHVHQSRRAVGRGTSPRTWSFIRQVLEGREAVVVPDVQQHPFFAREEFPPAGMLRGYVGVPVQSEGDHVSGALCVFDMEPLAFDARALDALSETGRRLALELDLSRERVDSHERFTALSRLALTDPVTALANRRGGEEALAREVSRARRTGSPLSLVLFDIDRFKDVNDHAGHAVGDRVLRGISEILSASQRGSDLAMRWGGEEFLVLLPDVGLAGARKFAERVRENVQSLNVAEAGSITVSAGVSELVGDEDPAVALARADANLYRAKAAGRNRVEVDQAQAIL